MTSQEQKPKLGFPKQATTAPIPLFLSPLRASLSICSPCMTPDKHRTTEQHSPGEFKLLIKLHYSWKQFLNYPQRLLARARTLHLQVLIARLSPPKPSYQHSWCQGVCAEQCRVLRHRPYRRLGRLGCFLTPPDSGGLERQKNRCRRKTKPRGQRPGRPRSLRIPSSGSACSRNTRRPRGSGAGASAPRPKAWDGTGTWDDAPPIPSDSGGT